jgi:quercetin dioxygenase-like cupin family protein
MSLNVGSDETTSTHTEAYYEELASQEQKYPDETDEKLRVSLTSEDPSPSRNGSSLLTENRGDRELIQTGASYVQRSDGPENAMFCASSTRRMALVKRKVDFMTFTKLMLALTCVVSGTLVAQEAKVTQQAKVTAILSKDLTNLPGKEGLMLTVEYPPGSSDPIHRHNAHGFIYVLEGSIVMQVRGERETILTPGQSFYEGPNDVHVVGRNASQTKPAKFLVFFVKDKGAPVLVLEPSAALLRPSRRIESHDSQ